MSLIGLPQLAIKPSLDKRGYRLKCRFKIEPYPREERLNREKVRMAERFVEDMHKQGWEYVERFGFSMKGPFAYVLTTPIHMPYMPAAREMLPYVAQGGRFLDRGGTIAGVMPALDATEWWEYELKGVFFRTEILVERPDLHEEENGH